MSRRDILKSLKNPTAYSKDHILSAKENASELTDLYKQDITAITCEIQKQREMSAPIKPLSFFDRLHCEGTRRTWTEIREQKEKLRKDAVRNFMFGYPLIGRKSAGNLPLLFIEARQRSTSVPPQEEEHKALRPSNA